jgi:branched-chain amino acid transport system ATP-binding protein
VSAILALEGISKSFGAVVIADELDLQLAEGEALGMLGPNGTGKTTLFGIITGMLAPNSGRVLFEGRDITHLSAARALPARRCPLVSDSATLRRHVGVRKSGRRRCVRQKSARAGCL